MRRPLKSSFGLLVVPVMRTGAQRMPRSSTVKTSLAFILIHMCLKVIQAVDIVQTSDAIINSSMNYKY
jgi:hypothetical protein